MLPHSLLESSNGNYVKVDGRTTKLTCPARPRGLCVTKSRHAGRVAWFGLPARSPQRVRRAYFGFCGFASKKSFTIGTITGMRSISVTWVVLGNTANLDAERGRRSP